MIDRTQSTAKFSFHPNQKNVILLLFIIVQVDSPTEARKMINSLMRSTSQTSGFSAFFRTTYGFQRCLHNLQPWDASSPGMLLALNGDAQHPLQLPVSGHLFSLQLSELLGSLRS